MTGDQLEKYIGELIEEGKLWRFYKHPEWLALRREILEEHHYECQHCKAQGRYTRARSVHHEQWVKKHPRLALSKTYVYKGKEYQNLIPLCEACHNKAHEKKGKVKGEGFTNQERW